MNLLNKLTIKNLKLNKKRTLVTVIGIMLSVALITAVASIYTSGIKSLINYEIYQKGNFHAAYFDVPISDIAIFDNNRSIENINLVQNIGYAKIDSKNEYKPYAFVKAFSKSSLENLSIKLVEGRLPENENEIIIPTHLKTNGRLELKVGENITLDIGKRIDNDGYELTQNNPYTYEQNSNESIINTITKTYEIVGIIERPATNIESYSSPGYTFITYMDGNNLNGVVDIYAQYTKAGTKNAYKITANLIGVNENLFEKVNSKDSLASAEDISTLNSQMNSAKYQINLNSYLIDLENNPISSSSIGGLGIVAGIVIGIIIFTSVFCIKNSFDISITEKTKQYGILRSIGATRKQIRKNVFYEASVLGTIGIPLGILSGFLASYVLILISNYYLKDMFSNDLKLNFSFSFTAVLVATILGIVTIYFSAFRSAKRASKVSPIVSIRNSADIKIKSKKIKSPKIIKKIFGIGGNISYKNLKRNKKKYRTTVISITVSVLVFIALSSFMALAFDVIDNELKLEDTNILLSASDFKEDSYKKFIETTNLDNIENYTILRQAAFKIKDNLYSQQYIDWIKLEINPESDNYLIIMVLGKEQYNKYIDSLGLKYNNIKDKVILSDYSTVRTYDQETEKFVNKYMRIYGLSKGDTVNITLDNNTEYELEIGYITEERPFGLKNFDNAMLIISDELFDNIATSDTLQIYYKSSNANKLQDDIDEFLKGEDYYLSNSEEQVRIMNNLFILIDIFLYGFIIVISLIGITNIFNTITTNMELRRQEFAMLKSIGMTTKEFNKMIRLESLFMGIKSLLVGIPIGIALSYVIYHFLGKEAGIPYKFPLLPIIISIATVFLLIFTIMKYSINKINKQNTIETIRNENI